MEAYQEDNGRFTELDFREAIGEANQIISLCRVDPHHQNVIIERCIKDITKYGRTLTLHVNVIGPMQFELSYGCLPSKP